MKNDSLNNQKKRLPPGQRLTKDFPILHIGPEPKYDMKKWTFQVYGKVENPLILSWEQFKALPSSVDISDFHCVTGWSRFDNQWEGVLFKDLAEIVKPLPEARFVTFECEYEYTTSLPLDQCLDYDVILAYGHDGKPLSPEHGGPLRSVVPKLYAYKAAKFLRKVKFTQEQELGYWELRGYSNTADPWKEERFS